MITPKLFIGFPFMMVSPLVKMACGVACLGGMHYYVAPTVFETFFFWGWKRTERKLAKKKLKDAQEMEALQRTVRYLQDKA